MQTRAACDRLKADSDSSERLPMLTPRQTATMRAAQRASRLRASAARMQCGCRHPGGIYVYVYTSVRNMYRQVGSGLYIHDLYMHRQGVHPHTCTYILERERERASHAYWNPSYCPSTACPLQAHAAPAALQPHACASIPLEDQLDRIPAVCTAQHTCAAICHWPTICGGSGPSSSHPAHVLFKGSSDTGEPTCSELRWSHTRGRQCGCAHQGHVQGLGLGLASETKASPAG